MADFDRATFDWDAAASTAWAADRSGGKARGLAFMRRLLAEGGAGRGLGDVRVTVPAAVVVATDVFDRFLDNNHLRDFALRAADDALRRRFEAAPFPADIRARPARVPRARALSAGRALVEPARGLAATSRSPASTRR